MTTKAQKIEMLNKRIAGCALLGNHFLQKGDITTSEYYYGKEAGLEEALRIVSGVW